MGLQEGRLLVGLGHVPDLLVEGIPVYKCTVITGYEDGMDMHQQERATTPASLCLVCSAV